MVENKYYERKIKYLDLVENGERSGGAGFIKTEVRGMDVSLTVTVKGLHPTDTYERDVMLQAGDSEFAVGRIALKEGKGQFNFQTVMDYSQLHGIRIVLGGAREICCKWQEKSSPSASKRNIAGNGTERNITVDGSMADQEEERKPHQIQKLQENQEIPWDEVRMVEESLERVEKIMSKPVAGDMQRASEKTVERPADRKMSEGDARGRENAEGGMAGKEIQERWTAMEKRQEWGEVEMPGKGTPEREMADRETMDEEASVRERPEREAAEKEISERRTAENEMSKRGGAAGEVLERGAAAWRMSGKGKTEKKVSQRNMTIGQAAGESRAGEIVENVSGMGGRKLDIEHVAMENSVMKRAEMPSRRMESGSILTHDKKPSGRRNPGSFLTYEKKPSGRMEPESYLIHEKKPVRLMEDKWQQIWAIYPHIHPFQDEREYLSVSPADFVLLPEEAYRAANNSFLLHGYYNYDHLILTKMEKRGEVYYYIGVPGNYYEREKQVAVMFGFESFECGTEPAQAGDFGYYMMRTQL